VWAQELWLNPDSDCRNARTQHRAVLHRGIQAGLLRHQKLQSADSTTLLANSLLG